MTMDRYSGDCIDEAALDGDEDLSLLDEDAEDAEDAEEPESAEVAAGYGSLLGLGSAMRKKRPALVLDPLEAENEARRVQYVAGQQFIGGDEPEGLAFFDQLAGAAPPDPPEIDEQASDDVGGAEPAVKADDCAEAILDEAAPIDFVPCSDRTVAIEEPAGDVTPVAFEEASPPDLAVIACAPAAETVLDPICNRPINSALSGHSLRARLPGKPVRRTLIDRLAGLLDWIDDWLARQR